MSEETPSTMNDTEGAEALLAIQSMETTMEEFFATADVTRVYGEKVQSGDTALIPAGEVVSAMAFGMGAGSGEGGDEGGRGSGVGGGGGGWAQSRPVAVIIATPSGIRVEPVIDITKIGLAALTAAGFMIATLARIGRRA